MVLMFVDMLGVRARWHHGGRDAVETAFRRFYSLVAAALREEDPHLIFDGVIESDSAAVLFETPESALRCARNLYRAAFQSARRPSDERLWLRGTIIGLHEFPGLREESPLPPPLGRVRHCTYSGVLLDAVSVEKSGIKGMRLLIHHSVVAPSVSAAFRIPVGERFLYPFRQLDNSIYPARLQGQFVDFLWMVSDDNEETRRHRHTMADRLRWCARDAEEILQAASTQVVFNECDAIVASLQPRRQA